MLPRTSTESPSVPPTFGSATSRLRKNGYCIAFTDPLAAALASEHAAVVQTVGGAGPLGMLICFEVNERELAACADKLLMESGLTGGPMRLGSDGVRIWVLRSPGYSCPQTRFVLGKRIGIKCAQPGASIGSIPLDGQWPQGTLLSVPYTSLPEITAERATALLDALERLT